jgi:glutamyl-tRNA reductase
MKLRVVGCSHHSSDIAVRERLAFTPGQTRDALSRLRTQYPETEMVLLSTCNRVELYMAHEEEETLPTREQVASFLADFHGLATAQVSEFLFEERGEEAVRHLFLVAASLDSMVVGEAQILSQVKQAYELATECVTTGPLTHSVFQAAIRMARRVARETAINQKRVSIPSIAVADFAKQLFERFDDKKVLVIGAGEMAEETLRYLINEGAEDITIVNRHRDRAEKLAEIVGGRVVEWEQLHELFVTADLIVSTTGAAECIVTVERFKTIHQSRADRPLFILDLAVPRDFDPAVGELPSVYLYSIDDLRSTCEANRLAREKEWPKAERILEDATAEFLVELNHRTTAPTIRRLRDQANEVKREELQRLLNKLGEIGDKDRHEITRAFDRLVNKLLHPPLESLRDEAARGTHHGLVDALRRLFQIRE